MTTNSEVLLLINRWYNNAGVDLGMKNRGDLEQLYIHNLTVHTVLYCT